jgi:hypothetical protein
MLEINIGMVQANANGGNAKMGKFMINIIGLGIGDWGTLGETMGNILKEI